jgi:hypothetical protein
MLLLLLLLLLLQRLLLLLQRLLLLCLAIDMHGGFMTLKARLHLPTLALCQ